MQLPPGAAGEGRKTASPKYSMTFTNGLITIAIRARFDYDSTTIRLQHATTRYEVFRSLAYESYTRISGRRVLHVD